MSAGARPQTRRCARRVGRHGRAGAGSHLGKSGWRPGRCAGPSSHWGGCWPSPASSTAWCGRLRHAEARARDASRSGSTQPRHAPSSAAAAPKGSCGLRGASADKSQRLGQASGRRHADTRWADSPHGVQGGAGVRRGPPGALALPRRGSPPAPGMTALLARGAQLSQVAETRCPLALLPGAPSVLDSPPGDLRAATRPRRSSQRRPAPPARRGRLANGGEGDMSEGDRRGTLGFRDKNVSAGNCTLERVLKECAERAPRPEPPLSAPPAGPDDPLPALGAQAAGPAC